jgi:hypothetical protein
VIASDGTTAEAAEDEAPEKSLMEQHQERMKKEAKKSKEYDPLKEEKERERKVREVRISLLCAYPIVIPCQAIAAQERQEQRAEAMMQMDERDRPYNSASKHTYSQLSEEDMEAYHMKKRFKEDPMAELLAKGMV